MELQLLGFGFAASDHQRAHGPAVPRRSTNKEQDCHHSGNSHLVVAPLCSRKSDPTNASRCRAAARFLTRPQAGQGFAPMPTFYRRPSKSYRTTPQRRSRAVPGTNRVKARSAHGIANQATTVMIRARAATTMIAHSVTQICEWHALSLHVRSDQTRGRFSIPHRKPREEASRAFERCIHSVEARLGVAIRVVIADRDDCILRERRPNRRGAFEQGSGRRGNDAQAAGTSASTAAATGATAAGCTCATFAAGPAARFA
jgi:hypothetical protein